MGHWRPKPTSLGTSSWWLFEALHARFLTLEQRRTFSHHSSNLRQRESSGWATWAPGLVGAVKQSWIHWRAEQSQQSLIEERKAHLHKVTKSDLLARHIANDHVPYRKDCSVRVAAQGRQRMHRRSQAKGVYAVSFDLAGPFSPGLGYDTTASGRDRHQGYRYFLACAFTIPVPTDGVDPSTAPPPSTSAPCTHFAT